MTTVVRSLNTIRSPAARQEESPAARQEDRRDRLPVLAQCPRTPRGRAASVRQAAEAAGTACSIFSEVDSLTE